MTIRSEKRHDWKATEEVVRAAFGSPDEAHLVALIRSSAEFIPQLSLIAEADGQIVGHVMISGAVLDDGDIQRRIANLSPLAVSSAHRRRGVGSALVRAVTVRADAMGEPLVVLQGDPRFYGRLGFEPAERYGIEMALPSWAPPEAAQVLRLHGHHRLFRGRVLLPPAFA